MFWGGDGFGGMRVKHNVKVSTWESGMHIVDTLPDSWAPVGVVVSGKTGIAYER